MVSKGAGADNDGFYLLLYMYNVRYFLFPYTYYKITMISFGVSSMF
jgi:hypothetical protein